MDDWKRYLSKLSVDDQVRAYIKTGDLLAAANIAHRHSNDALLNRVLAHCGPHTRGVSEQIVAMRQSIGSK